MQTNIHSLIFIPHIQLAIAQELSVSDLLSCKGVNRDWRTIFTPWYRRQKILWLDSDKDYRSCYSQAMLSNQGHHVRRLYVNNIKLIPTIVPYCRNITCLEIAEGMSDKNPQSEDGWRWQQYVQFMTSNCPQLKKLHLHKWTSPRLHGLVSALTETPSVNQSLQSLSFCCLESEIHATSVLLDLLLGLPQLTNLECQWHHTWRVDHDEDLLKRSTFRLRAMKIFDRSGLYFIDPVVLVPFWRQCPFLETFHASWRTRVESIDEFVSMFDDRDASGEPARYTRAISIPNSYLIRDGKLARVLRGCSNQYFTTLSMPRCPIESNVFQVLLETHFQNLETLELSGELEPAMNASPWIQRLLTSCPRLKVLLVMYSTIEITQGVHLHADDILTGPWVCSQLTTLMIPIMVGPKTGQVTKEGSNDRSAIINRVMQQIGRMSKLEELGTSKKPYMLIEVGRSFIHGGNIVPDLLSFTLGSGSAGDQGGGLQHLAGLKHMRELSVGRCALDLGPAEEKWMKKHWPDLQIISGRRKYGGVTQLLG